MIRLLMVDEAYDERGGEGVIGSSGLILEMEAWALS